MDTHDVDSQGEHDYQLATDRAVAADRAVALRPMHIQGLRVSSASIGFATSALLNPVEPFDDLVEASLQVRPGCTLIRSLVRPMASLTCLDERRCDRRREDAQRRDPSSITADPTSRPARSEGVTSP